MIDSDVYAPNQAQAQALNHAPEAEKEKAVIAMFTRENSPLNLIMFLNTSTKERAPVFGGSINGRRAQAFLRHPTDKRPFLSFVDDEDVQVATGNVVVNDAGLPLVAVREAGSDQTVWVSIGRAVSDELLFTLGADPAKLHVPKAQRHPIPA